MRWNFRGKGPYFGLLLAVMVTGALVAMKAGQAETLRVESREVPLYAAPHFGSPQVGILPLGAEVEVLSRSGDWLQVTCQGRTGWAHKTAFPEPRGPGFALPGMFLGGPVRETRTDEVALAGKGFTPEVEAAYRQKNPGMNYAQVDQVERFQVDAAQLAAFLREGGLAP